MEYKINEKIHECIHIFMSTDRLRSKLFDRNVKSLGIHHTQHRILMYISRHDGVISQKQISERFEISPAAVAGTIKKREHNGYITRTGSENDNRYNDIQITDKGRKIIDDSRSFFIKIDKKTFENFTDEEVEQLMYLLNKMKKSLSEEEGN